MRARGPAQRSLAVAKRSSGEAAYGEYMGAFRVHHGTLAGRPDG